MYVPFSDEHEVGYGTIPPILPRLLMPRTPDFRSKNRDFQQVSCRTTDFVHLSEDGAHHWFPFWNIVHWSFNHSLDSYCFSMWTSTSNSLQYTKGHVYYRTFGEDESESACIEDADVVSHNSLGHCTHRQRLRTAKGKGVREWATICVSNALLEATTFRKSVGHKEVGRTKQMVVRCLSHLSTKNNSSDFFQK